MPIFLVSAWGGTFPSFAEPPVPWYDYEIVRTYPHDPGASTQGLIFHNGFFFESTGKHGFSSIRKVRPDTGEVIRIRTLEDRFYGEGLVDWQDSLIQLTWKSETGFVFDRETFALQRTFRYGGQGWGLTRDGNRLIMSDGTATLRVLDANSLTETGRIEVRESGAAVSHLNELEMVRGTIFANVWKEKFIVMIDPERGRVIGKIDFSTLVLPKIEQDASHVLNGIAYDAERDRLFVTGKRWPLLFEIRIHKREQ